MKQLSLNYLPFEKRVRCAKYQSMKRLFLIVLLFAVTAAADWRDDVSETNPPWVAYAVAQARYEGYLEGLKAREKPEFKRVVEDKSKWPLLRRPRKEEK